MSEEASLLLDSDVARFLRENPDFFEQHADLLADLKLPDSHGGRAISLQERQLEVMRERHRGLERRLAELLRHGEENDAIGERLHRWTRALLLADGDQALADAVVDGLRDVFSVPMVAMRLWDLHEASAGLAQAAQPADADVRELVRSMAQPYCGANNAFQAAGWLDDGGTHARSIAMLPLRKGVEPGGFGLVVLGSSDPERFQRNMGISWLERIAETASAALSRLAG